MVLFLLPASDYDPTECAVPWQILTQAGWDVQFATPDGQPAYADSRLVTTGFGVMSPLFMTRKRDLKAYAQMTQHPAFKSPLRYEEVKVDEIQGLLIPGGHAKGVKTLLDSPLAQNIVNDAFRAKLPMAAVCHGVLLLARTRNADTGNSWLHGRKVTALPAWMEYFAYYTTRFWLGDYYRTYPESVEHEVKNGLAASADFRQGMWLPYRDAPGGGGPVNVVVDDHLVTARWPGDCYTFGEAFKALLLRTATQQGVMSIFQ